MIKSIKPILDRLPSGLSGFFRKWGLLQFAQATEAHLIEQNMKVRDPYLYLALKDMRKEAATLSGTQARVLDHYAGIIEQSYTASAEDVYSQLVDLCELLREPDGKPMPSSVVETFEYLVFLAVRGGYVVQLPHKIKGKSTKKSSAAKAKGATNA
jgi:hypothetical protein